MPQPWEIIYDLTIEKLRGIRPVTVFIKFDRNYNRHLLAAQDSITGNDILLTDNDHDKLEEAINLLKWAVKHDPAEQFPELVKFIDSI